MINNMIYVLGGIAAVVIAVIFKRHPPITTQDWASWVQAVGSIAAIAGAWIIARHQLVEQSRAEAARQAKANLATAEVCLALAKQTRHGIKNATDYIVNHVNETHFYCQMSLLEGIEESLSRALNNNIPVDLYEPLVSLQLQVIQALKAIKKRNGRTVNIEGRIRIFASNRLVRAEKRLSQILAVVKEQRAIAAKFT